MKNKSTYALALLIIGACSWSSSAQAQDAYVASKAAETISRAPAAELAAEAPATVVLTGFVTTSAGPLPGAVIKLVGSMETAVTDAEGRYHVRVPANTPVRATASYAGYRDQPVTLEEANPDVKLTTPQVVQVARKQRLQKYLKTARKQTRKTTQRMAL